MGKTTVKHHPKRGVLRKLGKAVVATIVAIATLVPGTTVANASPSTGPGYWMNAFTGTYVYAYHHGISIGIQGYKDGKPYYCVEVGVAGYDASGSWSNVTDTDSRIAAFMVDRHASDTSDFTQAAVAYAIHEHLDANPTYWADVKAHNTGLEGGDWNAVAAKATEFWNDAANNMPAGLSAQVAYTKGKRTGSVSAAIKNSGGKFVSGVQFTATLNGPAVFDATGSNTYTGTTNGGEQHLAWTATGSGKVTSSVSYKAPQAQRQNSPKQDMFTFRDPARETASVSFDVQKDFQPTITTQLANQLQPNQPVTDTVTSGVTGDGEWVNNVKVPAKGYFYLLDSTQAEKLTTFKRNTNETVTDYLKRVEQTYGAPVATGNAEFTGSGQNVTVTAKNEDGTDYTAPADGGVGTWVWVINKTDVDAASRDYITNDYVDEFGKKSESGIIPAQPSHDSVVLEQSSGMNTDIMDTITISNLPDDYGEFTGNKDYGFGADAKATIRVWWAGSGTGDAEADKAYEPNTTEEPAEDANHKIVGEWEVPAGNGTYKVGGGRITFRSDATGKTETVAENVNIRAENDNETGYYVFVYDFPGSSRAAAFKSDYNDPWERSLIRREANPRVDLTSNVSKTEVKQGEEFYDVAHINGQLKPGSYLMFTAWDAVAGLPDTSGAKLLDSERVDLTDEQIADSAKKSIDVKSPVVKTGKTGNVYWQVELYDADGNALASHELGIENETVIVRGVNVTTKVSTGTAYVGEEFHDTATITGELPDGAYVTFDAYGPADQYADDLPKILDSERVDLTDEQIKNSSWNTSFDVDSPDITAQAGNVYWVATVHTADGSVLATHNPGISGETVRIMEQSLTTHVSKTSAGLGEEFNDSADITGQVKAGDYVVFRAYEPVDGDPDENAGLLVDDEKVVITDQQAKDSLTGTITVTSGNTSADTAGHVYWKASLYSKDGVLLATHALGLPSETVTVTPPDITTAVSTLNAGIGEEFSDKATVTGKVERGSSVRFTAYGPTDKPSTDAKVLYTNTVKVSDKQADASATTKFTVDSGVTSTDEYGKVYWMAELLNPDGKVIANHELGLPAETVTIAAPTITTNVSSTSVGVGQEFHDSAIISGKVLEGSSVRFTAYAPVNGDPDPNGEVLYEDTVDITDQQAKDSATKTITVKSGKTSTMSIGNVYWKAELLSPKGKVIADHELGLPSETVTVTQPKITTQVTKTVAKPGQEFADKATIEGHVERGSYVLFTAYEPVPEDPDTTVGKLLDAERVDIPDADADKSGKTDITVTSPKTSSEKSGAVYWMAELHAPDGTLLSSHDLGLPSETTYIAPGGYLSSQAQVMGSTDEPLYDVITVYNESDGHEGNGNGNPSGLIGSIPAGSYVTVEAYRQDGNNTASKNNLIGSKDYPIDINQMVDGQLTFKAQDAAFTMHDPGMVYWVATLKTANGAVLDKAKFGESGDQHGTGVESEERTPVQEYSTTISKKWFSVNSDEYEEKTVRVYDVLKQTSWRQADGDVDRLIGQTAKGTKYRFEVWQQSDGDIAGDKLMWTGDEHEMPQSPLDPASVKTEVWQQMKSETFTIGEDWPAGTYYVRVLVTNDKVDNTVEGHEHVVKYTAARDEAETFRVFKVTSDSAEPLWTTDQKHVQDILHVEGTMPKGSSYQLEVWKVDANGDSVEKVGESDKITLDHDVTDTDIEGPKVDMPGEPGTYQHRFRVWSPDNLGGDPDIDDGSVILPDDWKQGDGYKDTSLLYEGKNVPSERFEVIRISTDVTDTNGMHAYKDEHYVDVTNGAQVGDHAAIEGHLIDGYKLGFELYRQAGDDEANDKLVATIPPTDLAAGTTELDSALTDLNEPGDYYWVTVFTKADGSAWKPDGETEVRSAKRVASESFHAVRVTTTTAKWTTNKGETKDVALIEGCLPTDALINFDLHDYETGDKVGTTGDVTLGDLGYKPCASGDDKQTVESPTVTLPAAKDHYFVESVRFPGEDEDHGFHRGNDRVDNESTRTIDATTETYVEIAAGNAIGDHTDLTNIHYSKDDGKDIRDDLTGPLTASWEVWKQGSGDTSTDKQLTTLADGEDAVKLEDGQTTAESPEYKFDEVGTYYFVVVIRDEDGNVLKRGEAREPSETVRVVKAESATDEVIEEGKAIKDTVTVTGPVLEGTMVSWDIYTIGDGDATTDRLVESWGTPGTGAYVITADDAAKALKDGSVTITSPKAYEKGRAGERVYFVFSLTSPKRGDDGKPMTPVKGDDGVTATDHLLSTGLLPIGEAEVDGDTATVQNAFTPFYTDVARTPSETASIVKVTTKANTHDATVGDKVHDTAIIDGYVPDGYCIRFEYWQQDSGDDAGKDKLITTTQCVPVPAGSTTVDSPEVTADKQGTFYWREKLVKPSDDSDKPSKPEGEKEITYGKPRVPDETVTVKPLAKTGVIGSAVIVLAGMLMLVAAGAALTANAFRRRRPHMSSK